MSSYTVITGRRYRATIKLGLFESALASATVIMARIVDAGFANVRVWGGGRTWYADGTWVGPTTTAALPSQIAFVEPIPEHQ